MKVFVTGASGFIGSAVIEELINAGHQVIGLARSEQSAKKISEVGAAVLKGSLEDLDILKQGASLADGIIHTAFFHDFTQFLKAAEMDKAAIKAMGEALMGTTKPIVVTAGILGLPLIEGYITEESRLSESAPRSSETTALALAGKGIHASVIRLAPSVHDKGDDGFVPFIIKQAQKNGLSAYPAAGNNHWPAVHRLDASKAYRLALEKGAKGALYNVVSDTGIEVKKIAAVIGEKLNLPVASLSGEELAKHFEWMSRFISFDSPATNLNTKEQLGWTPTHIGLIEDMQQNYL
ncbi:Nucleoside-diphosphate-sugar epimerase [Chitinophaga costaii]|uniref:Nucleoside-diphosphate-sugar epimerase n=1 Tax=Chitinophaga costaii TaxID=1335309 RepID=A0A1C4EXU5_9BACT|nr:SDR family oxidoreductase [Chitinophaga costaii]PUZ21571.1 3-beta hydroxysteroid dehydrogenase [Chitinophaga costaii]SCC48303.1 Nucleoside-diphosphate-sugar epimerase [Chitinophaga costaii]